MAKMLKCGFEVSEFELLLHYYIHFWTNTPWERYDPLYPPAMA